MKTRFCAEIGVAGRVSAIMETCQNGSSVPQTVYDHGGYLIALDARIAGGTASIAERIAEAWQQWGVDCPLHLHGDFAFFIHDRTSGESFCARDHIGARPLFYANGDFGFACASDIPTLLALSDIPQDLDEQFIVQALIERYFEPGEGSFYRAIRRLPAGHCLHRTAEGTRVWRWWKPEKLPVRDDISDMEAVSETRRLLEAAVAERLDGAGKIGLHLSGGIDSSLVAALVASQTKVEHSYCWQDLSATGTDEPEIQWIEAICAHLNLSVSSPKLSSTEMANVLVRDWTKHPDARNLLHEAAVQQEAQTAGVTRIFSGWGGDEGISFHGRGHKPWLLATGRWRELWRIAEKPGLRGALAEFYAAFKRLARDFWPLSENRKDAMARTLLDPVFANRVRIRSEPRFREFGARATQIALLQTVLTDRIEDWAISGAEHGIEYCYPLLDRALLEHILTLPPRMFVRKGERRWLVREVARGLVPELIRTNTSKNEVARGRQLEHALADAYREITRMLNEKPEPPAHAKYLDMEKVRKRLEKVDNTNSGRDKHLRRAIQLLDLT